MTENQKKLKELKIKIQNLRMHLEELIEEKNNLLNPDILAASKMLDALLNEYDKLIDERIDKNI